MGTFSKAFNKIEDRVVAAVKKSGQKGLVHVIYSAYKSDKKGNPIDNLDAVAVKGKVVLIGDADEFWGGKKGKDYRSPVLNSPTWLEVAVHANRMIASTLDKHHVFLEGLEKRLTQSGGDAVEYDFLMGS